MSLISITANSEGPLATRQGDLIIHGEEVGFGGFTTLIGHKSKETASRDDGERDVYLLGVTPAGLQLARVGINHVAKFPEFEFWEPKDQKFSDSPPDKTLIDNALIYMPGSFASGSVFFSPYFRTFIMVYFNKKGDSTFYIRYLDLNTPTTKDKDWKVGGRYGKGLEAEDTEALVRYSWSSQQKLYSSSPAKDYNYAGSAHPEFFNRQYFAKSLYPPKTAEKDRQNEWYGAGFVSADKANGQDGKFLLLSWTSQKRRGTKEGLYEVKLAVVEFDDIPPNPDQPKNDEQEPSKTTVWPPSSSKTRDPNVKVHGNETPPSNPHDALKYVAEKMKHGSSWSINATRTSVWWYLLILSSVRFLLRVLW